MLEWFNDMAGRVTGRGSVLSQCESPNENDRKAAAKAGYLERRKQLKE